MTVREHLNRMDDDDFAEWLCHQMWGDYGSNREGMTALNTMRFHSVRNFLKMEVGEEIEHGHT